MSRAKTRDYASEVAVAEELNRASGRELEETALTSSLCPFLPTRNAYPSGVAH